MANFSQQQVQSNKCASVKYKQGDSISGFTIDPRGRTMKNGVTHASSMIHPIAAGSWTNSKVEEAGSGRLYGSSRHGTDFKRQRSHMSQSAVDSSINQASSKETMVCNWYSPRFWSKPSENAFRIMLATCKIYDQLLDCSNLI